MVNRLEQCGLEGLVACSWQNILYLSDFYVWLQPVFKEYMANPGAVLLSGVLMLEHMGWGEAAKLVNDGLEATFAESEATASKGPGGKLYVTYDIARQFAGHSATYRSVPGSCRR